MLNPSFISEYLVIWSRCPNRFWFHPAPVHCCLSATVPHSLPDQLPDMTLVSAAKLLLDWPRARGSPLPCSAPAQSAASLARLGLSLRQETVLLLPCGFKHGGELGGDHHNPHATFIANLGLRYRDEQGLAIRCRRVADLLCGEMIYCGVFRYLQTMLCC